LSRQLLAFDQGELLLDPSCIFAKNRRRPIAIPNDGIKDWPFFLLRQQLRLVAPIGSAAAAGPVSD
jgi:hypothetical protein